MKLHENTELFNQAVRATAQQKRLLEIYIEKDYWVTFVLHTIFHHEIGKEAVFKGGTALSKCYGLIDRFSEDIDLVVIRRDGETNNQLTNKIKKISKVVSDVIPEVQVEGVTHKMGMNRKTAHSYTKVFEGNYGQVRDVIIVEATWLGYHEPYLNKNVSSYIYEMMVQTGQEQLADEYGLLPFDLMVLDAKRTLCEKIMSLVRFSNSENPIEDLNNKIRHCYDINRLLQDKDIRSFFYSKEFDSLLLKVAQDDIESYKSGNEWLNYHPNQAIIFSQPDETWGQMKNTYQGIFKDLVYGELPDENKILSSLKMVAARLAKIEWTIDMNS